MAKAIDYTKIKRVQQAAMELIVENGIGGASISMISKKANVADGYLYRFYKSKNELVEDILHNEVKHLVNFIKQLLNKKHNRKVLFEKTIRHIFNIGRENPIRIKFLYVLLNNYNFQVSKQQIESISMLFSEIIENSSVSDNSNNLTKEQLVIMLIIYPIQYINFCFKGYFSKGSWNETDENNVIKFAINALVNQN